MHCFVTGLWFCQMEKLSRENSKRQGEHHTMRYIIDLTRIIIAKLKYSKKLVVMTIVNLTVGLCIFTIFVNMGLNVNVYLKDNYFGFCSN